MRRLRPWLWLAARFQVKHRLKLPDAIQLATAVDVFAYCGPQYFDQSRLACLASARLWHDRCVIASLQIVLRLLSDGVWLVAFSLRPQRSLGAESLFLRRQLALYKERGV